MYHTPIKRPISTPELEFHTPLTFSKELKQVLNERNLLTAKTRKRVCSLLDRVTPDNYEEVDKRKSFRLQAIQEIVSSEKTYLKQLEVLMQFFVVPLKKHSSHSITADTSLLETAKAAEFFLTDGIIVTGTATGDAANPDDLDSLYGKLSVPLIIGSGVTKDNLKDYYNKANAVIIGSHFKVDGHWANSLCEQSIVNFMQNLNTLRNE